MVKHLLLFIVLSLVLRSHLLSQEISFSIKTTVLDISQERTYGFQSPGLAMDYNSDGIADIIMENGSINVYPGITESEVSMTSIGSIGNLPLKVVDYDGDGDEDLLTGSTLLANRGNGEFDPLRPNSFGAQMRMVEMADFNNDGIIDFVTHGNEGNFVLDEEIVVHLSSPTGEYVDTVASFGYTYRDLDIGDIDNDGDIDIVVVDKQEDFPIIILFNDGNGYFSEVKTPHVFTVSAGCLSLVDLDQDGDLDIMVNPSFNNINLIENDEFLLTENRIKTLPTARQVLMFTTADLNNNGREEVAYIVDSGAGNLILNVSEQTGDFEFGNAIELGTYPRPQVIAYPNINYTTNTINLYDFNTDGKVDVVYSDRFTDNAVIDVYFNGVTSSVSEDLSREIAAIYPNPASASDRYITFSGNSYEGGSYKIFSLTGNVLTSGTVTGSTVDISTIPAGSYVISIEDKITIPFIKL